jgi:hypothetical protein
MNYEKYIKLATKNILDLYKNDPENFYLFKNFTEDNQLGVNVPNYHNPYAKRSEKNTSHIQVVDVDNDYYINELGLRGEINFDSDILAAGHSVTFGMGVPENGIWTKILSKKINKDIVNLGNPGVSVKKTCDLIIKYASKYKIPKTVFVLFPTFFRSMLIEDVDFYSTTKNMYPMQQRKIWKQEGFDPKIFYDTNKNFISFKYTISPRYFKSKYKNIEYLENVLSPHQLILDAVDSISNLEYFCSSHNIDLHWSTLCPATHTLMENLLQIPNFKLKKYFTFFDPNLNNNLNEDGSFSNKSCTLKHNTELINHPSWELGSDKCIDINDNLLESWISSPGIHFHYHIADLFYNKYN